MEVHSLTALYTISIGAVYVILPKMSILSWYLHSQVKKTDNFNPFCSNTSMQILHNLFKSQELL